MDAIKFDHLPLVELESADQVLHPVERAYAEMEYRVEGVDALLGREIIVYGTADHMASEAPHLRRLLANLYQGEVGPARAEDVLEIPFSKIQRYEQRPLV